MNPLSLLQQPNNPMKIFPCLLLLATLYCGCSKKDSLVPIVTPEVTQPVSEFTHYKILQGNHYCDVSAIKAIHLTEQKFKVRFDSSAVYKSSTEDNQFDINKLYGFSEGWDPHINSARIGWSYNNDSLRLYGYVYNNSLLATQEITTCKIGEVINCSIKIDKNNYTISVNDKTTTLQRGVAFDFAEGYQLYPYFGGDDKAPHNINIYISTSTSK